jgi:hypothetical protein
MITSQDAPPTHCPSEPTEQHYNMFDYQCKYCWNPYQQSEEPLLGGHLKHKSVSLEKYAGKLQLSLPQP